MKDRSKVLSIKPILHTPKNAAFAGGMETQNSMLKNKLPKICQGTQLKWPDALPLALMSMRSTPNRPTGLSLQALFISIDASSYVDSVSASSTPLASRNVIRKWEPFITTKLYVHNSKISIPRWGQLSCSLLKCVTLLNLEIMCTLKALEEKKKIGSLVKWSVSGAWYNWYCSEVQREINLDPHFPLQTNQRPHGCRARVKKLTAVFNKSGVEFLLPYIHIQKENFCVLLCTWIQHSKCCVFIPLYRTENLEQRTQNCGHHLPAD